VDAKLVSGVRDNTAEPEPNEL